MLGYRRFRKSGNKNVDLIHPNSTRRQAGELNVRTLIESGSGIPYALERELKALLRQRAFGLGLNRYRLIGGRRSV
jgi:hypothetical protein